MNLNKKLKIVCLKETYFYNVVIQITCISHGNITIIPTPIKKKHHQNLCQSHKEKKKPSPSYKHSATPALSRNSTAKVLSVFSKRKVFWIVAITSCLCVCAFGCVHVCVATRGVQTEQAEACILRLNEKWAPSNPGHSLGDKCSLA